MAYEHAACFLLEPSGGMRFGAHAEDLTASKAFPSADTLFGALTWAVGALDGPNAAAEWVASFVSGRPPVLLSSAAPYFAASHGGGIAFVPRPQRRSPGTPSEGSTEDRKRLKDVRYVEAGVIRWYAGAEREFDPVPAGALLWRSAPPVGAESSLWAHETRPGVAIDRVTAASNVYTTTPTHYHRDCRLACYVLADGPEHLDTAERLLEVLGETGMGGGRSRGLGRFTFIRTESALPLAARPRGLALSAVWPRPEERSAGALDTPVELGYRLVERQAWITSPAWHARRSRTVAMLEEGSYLAPGLEEPVGGMVDVTPLERGGRHPVYRYGFGLFLDEERL